MNLLYRKSNFVRSYLAIRMNFFYFSDINECGSNPCQNGATCNDELNNYTCICDSQFTGKNCDIGKKIYLLIFIK